MNEELKKAVEETKTHYIQMIEWANTQDQEEFPDRLLMEREIRTSWGGTDCPMCSYRETLGLPEKVFCTNCVLYQKNTQGRLSCVKGYWGYMNDSLTWKDWLQWARCILTIIEGIEV